MVVGSTLLDSINIYYVIVIQYQTCEQHFLNIKEIQKQFPTNSYSYFPYFYSPKENINFVQYFFIVGREKTKRKKNQTLNLIVQ
jgi:hypothetical protein